MTYSVCIVGAGIGAQHCDGYAVLPQHYSIHSVCDLDEARGRPLAEKFGAGFIQDIDNALADPAIDIIDICLPPHLHFSACMAALEAGKIARNHLLHHWQRLTRLSRKSWRQTAHYRLCFSTDTDLVPRNFTR